METELVLSRGSSIRTLTLEEESAWAGVAESALRPVAHKQKEAKQQLSKATTHQRRKRRQTENFSFGLLGYGAEIFGFLEATIPGEAREQKELQNQTGKGI
jgi:hypothetical protein